MGDKIRKSPNIRFKGFTDDWEQRKLGEVFNEYSEKNHKDLPLLTIIQGNGTIRRDESDRKMQYDKKSLSNYKMVKKDDFIVHLRSFEGGLEKSNITGIISPAYHTLHGENTDSRFYYAYFRSHNFINIKLKPHVYGVRDGRSIDMTGMKIINIPFTIINEQNKIGELIESFDNLITIHQCKLELLKDTKKSMLQKMFPKDGETVPEIRFEGFTDNWEQRKLGETADIISGGTPSTNNSDYWDGDINWYSPAEIGDEIYVYESQRKITSLGLEKSSAKILPADKTILFSSRAGIGTMAILKAPAATNQGFQSLVIKNSYDTYFVYSMGSLIKQYAEKVASGSTFLEISGKTLGNMDILLPSCDEQEKIGGMFLKIDNLITLHQRELDLLKDLKKSMLKQMFI